MGGSLLGRVKPFVIEIQVSHGTEKQLNGRKGKQNSEYERTECQEVLGIC